MDWKHMNFPVGGTVMVELELGGLPVYLEATVFKHSKESPHSLSVKLKQQAQLSPLIALDVVKVPLGDVKLLNKTDKVRKPWYRDGGMLCGRN